MKFLVKIILPALLFLLVACKKDHNVLGVDVQPSADELNAEHLDGLLVTGHTLSYDSVASFNDKYKYIGSNEDPKFGKTDIGIYLNTNISTKLDFKTTSVLSSADIILAVDPLEFAGDKFATLTYSVFPLINKLGAGAKDLYYTSNARQHSSTPISISSSTFQVDGTTGQAYIKINIDPAYASALMHDTPNLENNDIFQEAYKGYYIAASTPNGTEGVIFKANLEDALSGFFIRYKPNPAVDSTLSFRFTFSGTSAAKYNTLKFDPLQTIKDQFQDSTLGANNLYLKGMGMTKLKIEIPFLKNYSDSFQIAVNRAELILNVDPNFTSAGRYTPPPRLTLLALDSLGRETYVKDLIASNDYSRFDGNYDATNNRYVFNIAREAQQIFNGFKKNYGYYVVVANTDASVKTDYATSVSKELTPVRRDTYIERVVLAGWGNATLKPKFNLSYIKFKND